MPSPKNERKIIELLLAPAGIPVLKDTLLKHIEEAQGQKDYDRLTDLLELRKYVLELEAE